jgi:ABC-type branched-subunit amino acid transport system substrate-binding protein
VLTPHTAGRIPYVYTTFYEGGEDTDGVYVIGETPEQQLFPALDWLRENEGLNRWCIVGNDYVRPRMMAGVTMEYMRARGIDFVGAAFVPLGGRDFREVLELIATSRAEGVLVLMVGADNAAFNRAFARAGVVMMSVFLVVSASARECETSLVTSRWHYSKWKVTRATRAVNGSPTPLRP